MSGIRILLADDHIQVRKGLARLLETEQDLEIVGEAANGEEAVNLVRETRPDIVFMDVSMPGMNGIEATRIIHHEFPQIKIIGLSMFKSEEQAAKMRAAGAVNYLAKSEPPEIILSIIRSHAPVDSI